jgi:hypothetical protein
MQIAFTGFTTTPQSTAANSRKHSNIGALAALMAVASLVPTLLTSVDPKLRFSGPAVRTKLFGVDAGSAHGAKVMHAKKAASPCGRIDGVRQSCRSMCVFPDAPASSCRDNSLSSKYGRPGMKKRE